MDNRKNHEVTISFGEVMRTAGVLPRNDMANWVIRCSEEWMTPVYDRIHEKLMECQVLHMDETRIEMLTKALTYATNQKEYLETFMEDGRLPISNNLCRY